MSALIRIQQFPHDQSKAPDATHFRVGDWWVSPRGSRFLIVARVGEKVAMRQGGTQRQKWRAWDAIGAHSSQAWVRERWGGEA